MHLPSRSGVRSGMKHAGLCLLMLIPALAAAQASSTWHVDVDVCPAPGSGSAADPFCSIQAGIAAADDGDVVLVAPGQYDEAIDLLGKTIHLRSSDGAQVTTIERQIGSVITCKSGETSGTIIEGFTVTGGSGTFATHCGGTGDQEGYFGGGLYVIDSSVTVRGCIFSDNGNVPGDPIVAGGAVYVFNGEVAISASHFSGNAVEGEGTVYGASTAICGLDGQLTVIDSSFDSNGRLHVFGGGVFDRRASTTVKGCTFTNNVAAFGGGVFSVPLGPGRSIEITDSTFIGNSASHGGGVFAYPGQGPTARLINSVFIDNTASGSGGGASIAGDEANITVSGCVFSGNEAHDGGGLSLNSSWQTRIRVDNCLMFDNHAVGTNNSVRGGGLSAVAFGGNGPTWIDISNLTVVDNSAVIAGGGVETDATESGEITFSNSIVRGNSPDEVFGPGFFGHNNVEGGIDGPMNVDAPPLFVDPDGRDYRLRPGSPCIDAGDNAATFRAEADLDGQPRQVDDPDTDDFGGEPRVDMGAYEFPHGSLLRFAADGMTLNWPRIIRAVFYNVYRGHLSELVDADGDGLPDGLYGACAISQDPDSSDTMFYDPQLPEPGAGYFYLMSTVDATGGERFLGTTSAGLSRMVAQPCP